MRAKASNKSLFSQHTLNSNAGISSHGNSVDLPLNDIHAMIQLNVAAASTLTHLYGKDMKERRRGRILMVSSICGAVAGIPSVAVYSATKAFEKTLSLSMAKELERFGVGVTCLLPGAISETGFRTSSNAQDALCWHIPSYARPPRQIAEAGVRAMLLGETEVMPGWMNRAFIKVLMPIVPQRIHNWIAEVMWNPVELPFWRASPHVELATEQTPTSDRSPPSHPHMKFQSPPRLLQIEEPSSTASQDHVTDATASTEETVSDEAPVTNDAARPAEIATENEGPSLNRIDKSD